MELIKIIETEERNLTVHVDDVVQVQVEEHGQDAYIDLTPEETRELIAALQKALEIPNNEPQQINNEALLGVVLPSKELTVARGYNIANNAHYNYRRVLKEPDHDIYFSGWMDCFDWIKGKITT